MSPTVSWTPKRPWCFPCRPDGCRCWASHFGVACEWHYEILSDSDKAALAEAVRRRHPRGGRVKDVIEQLWIVRMELRNGGMPNRVEETWADDHSLLETERAEELSDGN